MQFVMRLQIVSGTSCVPDRRGSFVAEKCVDCICISKSWHRILSGWDHVFRFCLNAVLVLFWMPSLTPFFAVDEHCVCFAPSLHAGRECVLDDGVHLRRPGARILQRRALRIVGGENNNEFMVLEWMRFACAFLFDLLVVWLFGFCFSWCFCVCLGGVWCRL